ncbi:lipase chaperone [Cupriavidus taiwanensis]|uniref:lipase secretion chaperone n=1 Tax=Cupriavidus taiwanensis TaxID=164546 RepID=UPI000E1B070D|nr:lipase secretion chaperone [Cupriavidus taiwanensis]SOZ15910.1 lipase chaperone [Cupriavidus taiwanensis]SOZ29021.1 lipase chaperone [Cupriavidus taiwanensis]SOZ46481.1 lipase chaperone [Cupriavidus taiwanensis]
MTSSERAPRIWLALLPAGAAAAAVYWLTMGTEPAPVPRQAAVANAAASLAPSTDPVPAGAAAWPSLAGVEMPAGPEADAAGNLRLTRALRTYFDYFLSARHDAGGIDALDPVVHDDIRRHVPQPAAGQAWQLWRRYVACLAEIQPEAARKPLAAADGTLDAQQVQQLRALLAQRNAARQRCLPEVAQAWFGDEQAYDEAMLARLEIVTQAGLDDAQRRQRLAELDPTLPEPLRAASAASARPQAISQTISELQAAGRTTQDIGAALAQAYGPEVAQRYQQQAQAEQSWQQRYDDYAARRAQIEAFAGLSEQDRRQQLDTLRRQAFDNPSEALQAEVVDQAMAARRQAR